jgi:hypothetical protein
MARDLAAVADFGAFLDLHEGPDLDVIADLAAVEIDESKKTDALAQPDVRGDLLIGLE